MCIHIYIYMYTCVHIYIYRCVYIYIHGFICKVRDVHKLLCVFARLPWARITGYKAVSWREHGMYWGYRDIEPTWAAVSNRLRLFNIWNWTDVQACWVGYCFSVAFAKMRWIIIWKGKHGSRLNAGLIVVFWWYDIEYNAEFPCQILHVWCTLTVTPLMGAAPHQWNLIGGSLAKLEEFVSSHLCNDSFKRIETKLPCCPEQLKGQMLLAGGWDPLISLAMWFFSSNCTIDLLKHESGWNSNVMSHWKWPLQRSPKWWCFFRLGLWS